VYEGREVNLKCLDVIKASKRSYILQSRNIDWSRGRTHTNRVYRIETSSEDITLT
jgi:hypothetical protein